MKRFTLFLAALLFATLVLFAPSSQPAAATGLVVTNVNDSGPGSLRQAITDANATPTLDRITFGFEKTFLGGTISLITPLPTITAPLTITGPGAGLLTVNANNTGRVFIIDASQVAISGLTLTGGKSDYGGAVYITPNGIATLDNLQIVNNSVTTSGMITGDGGGISNDGVLTLSNSVVSNNKGALGGGISNFFGTNMTITNTQIVNNILVGSGGFGGGIFNLHNATISNSTISNNNILSSPGCCGGGIANFNDPLTEALLIDGSHVDGNTAPNGGGIINGGLLEIQNSTINNNVGTSTGGGGGGILNLVEGPSAEAGTIIIGSTISGNKATGAGGAGGGIWNCGQACSGTPGDSIVAVDQSTVVGNQAGAGGGINSFDGITLLVESTLSGNSAGTGGGVRSSGSSSSGFIAEFSTINGNSTTGASGAGAGGGVYNSALGFLIDSTVSGNSVSAGNFGGGIYHCSSCASGTQLLVIETTLSGNSASQGGAFYHQGSTASGVTLFGSIFANTPSGGNCSGVGTSFGSNLSNDATCPFGGPGDIASKDPKLAPLADNGGFTKTQALMPGSPAIDAADNSLCTDTDQRGRPRPVDGDGNGIATCDIGAFEFIPGELLQKGLFQPPSSSPFLILDRSAPALASLNQGKTAMAKAEAQANALRSSTGVASGTANTAQVSADVADTAHFTPPNFRGITSRQSSTVPSGGATTYGGTGGTPGSPAPSPTPTPVPPVNVPPASLPQNGGKN